MNYNRVILGGHLTRDPESRQLPSGSTVCEFGLAVNRKWRSQDGQQREDVCFVDCRCYGKSAEVFMQYMRKGRSVLVEGRLQLDTWEGNDGQRRSKHRIFVENFQFGDGGGDRDRPQVHNSPAPAKPQTTPAKTFLDPPPTGGDDIPF